MTQKLSHKALSRFEVRSLSAQTLEEKREWARQAVEVAVRLAKTDPSEQRVAARLAERWNQLCPPGPEKETARAVQLLLDGHLPDSSLPELPRTLAERRALGLKRVATLLPESNIAQPPAFEGLQQLSNGLPVSRSQDGDVRVGDLPISAKSWSHFEEGYAKTLSRAASAFETAQGVRAQPQDGNDVRTVISLGRGRANRTEHLAELRELNALSHQITDRVRELQAQGRAPKGVYIVVDGVDAASKTSNGLSVLKAFERAGYKPSKVSFKARTPEEKAEPQLARYKRHEPGCGEALHSDRSPLGDFAYQKEKGPEDAAAMGADFAAWEKELEAKGILVFKYVFNPLSDAADPDEKVARPVLTFGKREARAVVAQDFVMRQALEGVANPGMEAATQGPGESDLKSFLDGGETEERFLQIARASGGTRSWIEVPSDDRHEGRVVVLQSVLERLG